MKITMKKSLAVVMALVMCVSVLFGMNLSAFAADTNTVNYVYDSTGKYIYNWGTRGTTATFLSPNAEDFYTEKGVTLSGLSALAGSSSINSVPSSALYQKLYTLMATTTYTSYDATRDLFKYTDCQNSGNPETISSFYSGDAIGPEWDSGSTWNREHVWPNSKSNGGSNSNTRRETDIMMLRPTAKDENGDRSNTAYGESGSYYNPNSESGGALDLRGDVARVVLYVYVRWGGDDTYHDGATDYMWGTSGVIESKEILLKWMQEDPVDTWEMGRNDSTEAILGTRNVFVDYPELAYTLFDEEIPADFSTPSQGTSTEEGESTTTPATVKYSELDSITKTVSTAVGQTITLSEHTTTVKDGYTFLGWVENPITGEATDEPATIYAAGAKYSVNSDTTLYALYSRTEQAEGEGTGTAVYKKVTSAPADWSGDYLIVYEDGKVAFNGGLTTLDATSNTISVTINENTIESKATTDAAIFTINANGHIKSKSGYYIGQTSNANGLKSSTSTSYSNTISINANGTVNFVSGGAYLRFNAASDQNRFRYYKSSSYSGQKAICLYKYEDGSSSIVETTYYFTSDGSEPIYTVTAVSSNTAHGTVSTEDYVITASPVVGYRVSGYSIYPENSADVDQNGNEFTVSNLTANVDITIYFEALPSDGYYVKVDGELHDWSGKYLIVYEDGALAFNASLDNLNATTNHTVNVSINDNQIERNSATKSLEFTVTKSSENDGKYNIASSITGEYLGHRIKSSADITENLTTAQPHIISFVDGNIKILGQHNYSLLYNNSSPRFRYYESTSTNVKPIALYKFVENFDADSTLSASVNNELYGTYSTVGNIIYAKPAYGYRLKGHTITGATVEQNGNMFVLTDITDADITFEFATNEYTLYFKENGTVISTIKGDYNTTVDLPTNIGNAGNGKFVGWALEGTTAVVTQHEITGDATFVAVYEETESGGSGETTNYYQKVTSTDELTDGQYLIVYETGNVAFNGDLTTLDGVNNTIGISFKADGTIEQQRNTTAAEFTISAVEGGHSVTSASGYYIYKTAYSNGLDSKSSSNAFKTDYINVITFDVSGNAVLTTGNTADKTTLRFNAANDQKRFRYYKSGQQAIQLYKLVEVGGAAEPSAEIKGAQVEVGANLSVNYYVSASNITDESQLKMNFTLVGADNFKIELTNVTYSKNENGYYVFTFANIPPQHMTDTLKAEVYLGDALLTNLGDYSIQTNAINLLKAYPNDTELKRFITDMLYYGAAAQNYRDYNTDNLATDGVEGLGTQSTATPANDDNKLYLSQPTGSVQFRSATVWFDVVNALVVKVNNPSEASIKVTVKIDDGAETILDYDAQTGGYKTDGILATDFATVYTFTLYEGDAAVQTLNYSINTYAYSKQNSINMAELANALYNYGKSAETYAAAVA